MIKTPETLIIPAFRKKLGAPKSRPKGGQKVATFYFFPKTKLKQASALQNEIWDGIPAYESDDVSLLLSSYRQYYVSIFPHLILKSREY